MSDLWGGAWGDYWSNYWGATSMSQNNTFSSSGTLSTRWRTKGRWSEVVLGKDGQTFPSSLKIQKVTQDGGVATLREFTSAPTNRSILLETAPGSTVDIDATVSSDFYVEMNDLAEA